MGFAASLSLSGRIHGALLGGAVGDALGAPVERLDLPAIRARFGPDGIADFAEAFGRVGAVTDDTQMTLFTAEGLVRAAFQGSLRGVSAPHALVHHAYLRWLLTQGIEPSSSVVRVERWPDGWLVKDARLWARRGPGATCLTALAAHVRLGDFAENESKGCGTVMRVAPVGALVSARSKESARRAFELGVDVSRLTHGHPTGYLAGGACARIVAGLVEGHPLRETVEATLDLLAPLATAREVTAALRRALALADDGAPPSAEQVERLGAGFTAEEALAIAVYAALVARDFEHGVRLAVNHSGDSDSTGAIAGQLLGATLGEAAVPAAWRERVELGDVVEALAADLVAAREGRLDTEDPDLYHRYPGW